MSREVEIQPADADEVVLLRLSGQEWVRAADLGRIYGVSKETIVKLCDTIAESHQMRVRDLGDRSTVINMMDFRRGLVAIAPVRQGYTRRGL